MSLVVTATCGANHNNTEKIITSHNALDEVIKILKSKSLTFF